MRSGHTNCNNSEPKQEWLLRLFIHATAFMASAGEIVFVVAAGVAAAIAMVTRTLNADRWKRNYLAAASGATLPAAAAGPAPARPCLTGL